jgi:hypothetical protein
VYSKDRLIKELHQFRKDILEDDVSFNIKKITKADKIKLQKLFESGKPIKDIDNMIITFFMYYLKVNLVVIKIKEIYKGILCNEDGFETIIIRDKKGNGEYKINQIDNKHTFTWANAKEYLFENMFIDKKFLDICSANDMKKIAGYLGISIFKDENGKQKRLLKDELKIEISNKI